LRFVASPRGIDAERACAPLPAAENCPADLVAPGLEEVAPGPTLRPEYGAP
jgi:hypothetical protein